MKRNSGYDLLRKASYLSLYTSCLSVCWLAGVFCQPTPIIGVIEKVDPPVILYTMVAVDLSHTHLIFHTSGESTVLLTLRGIGKEGLVRRVGGRKERDRGPNHPSFSHYSLWNTSGVVKLILTLTLHD